MRHHITAAASAAILASAVNADCSAGGASEILGNWYCDAVDSISYQNFDFSGTYQRVTNMDPNSGTCEQEPFGFSGSLGPLDDEVSLSFRGPFHMSAFAYYKPGSSVSKRTSHHKRHGHAHFHEHEERNAVNDSHQNKKREDWIVATINGQVVSWTNTYGAPAATPAPSVSADAAAPSAPAPAPSPAAGGSTGSSGGSSGSSGSSGSGGSGKPFEPSASGDWVRAAHYIAAKGKSEGITFLNNYGGTGSGTFDFNFGNSLSYASADGQTGSSSSQVLKSTVLPSNHEMVMFTDKLCSEFPGCGYSRPQTLAYHGFDNKNAVYLFQFSMPHDDVSGGLNPDMPALWMLNAQIPRTLQYGDPTCSCWKSGCGEFDIFEVLDKGNTRAKSTLHSTTSGGSSDYFDRPTGAPIKVAVVMSDSTATIKVLPDDFDFSKTLTDEDVQNLGSASNAGGLLGSLGSSIFNLVQMGTSGNPGSEGGSF